MGKSLKEIVDSALSEAESGIKLASARDAVAQEPEDFLATELAIPSSEKKDAPEAEQPPAAETKTASDHVLTDCDFAIKLAEALESAAPATEELRKRASSHGTSHTDAPGPETMESGHMAPSKQPVAQSNSVKGPEASHGGGPLVTTGQGPNGVRNSMPDYRDPDWTKNKEASLRLVRAKQAEAETLRRMGQEETARALEAQAEHIHQKVAQDPSSPQPKLPSGGTGGIRPSTELPAGTPSRAPSNEKAISMTRAQARNKTQAEAAQYFSERPKKDNAASHFSHTEGLKISSDRKAALQAYLTKAASLANDPSAPAAERARAEQILATVEQKLAARG